MPAEIGIAFGKSTSILGIYSAGAKYRPKEGVRGGTRQPGGSMARPRGDPRRAPSWAPGGGPPAMSFLNFHTLLIIFGLTYKLSAPSCQFLFSTVFVFQVFRPLKVLQKFQKNYIKNQHPGSFPKHQGRKRGPPPGLQKGPWRGSTLGRVGHPPSYPVAPLVPPLALFLPPRRKP